VGKTTTAVNLSAAISRLDRRVLLVDLDPQSNATVSLGIPPNEQKNTTYALLNGGPFQPLRLTENLHLIPSNIELAGAEMELTSVIGREIVLRDALAEISGYDFMILDCSPSLGLLSVNALTTAKEVMVPMQCEFLALHGISLLIKTVDLVRKRLNPELSITGVIPCMYDVRKGLARDVVVEIEKHFGSKVFRSKIRSNVRLAEAPSHGKSIFDYAPDSYGAEDYLALAREIVGIEKIDRATLPLPVLDRIEMTTPPLDVELSAPVPELVHAMTVPLGAAEGPAALAPAPSPGLPLPSPAPSAEHVLPVARPDLAPQALLAPPALEPSSEPAVPAPDSAPASDLAVPAPAPDVAVERAVPPAPVEPAPELAVPAPPPDHSAGLTLPSPTMGLAPDLLVPESTPDLSAGLTLPSPTMDLAPDLLVPGSTPDFSDGLAVPPPTMELAPTLVVPGSEPDACPTQDAPPSGREPSPALQVPRSFPEPEPVESSAAAPATPPEQATPDIVSDGVVEFIELIPLEIEDLP